MGSIMPFWLVVTACQSPPNKQVSPPTVGGEAVFHRLTETQINNALKGIFDVDYLPHLALPPEVEVNGFFKQRGDKSAITLPH